MNFGPFEIFLLIIAAVLLLFLVLWAREELSRWWTARHTRKEIRRDSRPAFYKRH